MIIPSFLDLKYKDMTLARLSMECKFAFEYIANSTSLPSESLLWYEHRIGRLTASNSLGQLIVSSTISAPHVSHQIV